MSLSSLCVCDLCLNRSAFIYMYLLSTNTQVTCGLIFPTHKGNALFRVHFSYKGNAEMCGEVKTRWLNVLYLTEKPVIVSVTEGSVYFDVLWSDGSSLTYSAEKKKRKMSEGDIVRTVELSLWHDDFSGLIFRQHHSKALVPHFIVMCVL